MKNDPHIISHYAYDIKKTSSKQRFTSSTVVLEWADLGTVEAELEKLDEKKHDASLLSKALLFKKGVLLKIIHDISQGMTLFCV